ncbi:MAG: hypothetical protein H6624_02795 [Bdellovibrionaceae bacterium]|nr:hypothetical protein [Bdellovibrionales bacterium]MCB9083240.1 hypothetical protein [Pseudobdellovibrionaceae bacterium]
MGVRKPACSFRRVLVGICCIGLLSSAGAEQPPDTWAEKMQEAAKVLADGFPFLYSKREFRQPQNVKRIESYIERFKQSSHTLPVSVGERFIGLDPLIDQFNTQITQVLDEAAQSFKAKQHDVAQSQVKMAVHKCFACHTAYQMGPQIKRMNVEVKGIPLDAMSKVEVLVALRQFAPALKIIEGKLKQGLKKSRQPVDLMPFLRMHLLISVRSLQDVARAQKAIGLFQKSFAKTKTKAGQGEPTAQWSEDLKFWLSLKGGESEKLAKVTERSVAMRKTTESAYVLNLLKSFLLHQTLIDRKNPEALAQVYWQLGQVYRDLEAPILQDLPKIYFAACREAAPKGETAKKCM